MRTNKPLGLLFFFLLAGAPSLRAQVSASITGVVTDTSGARIASATVTVKNVETGAIRSAATDDAGRYQVLALPVGEYEEAVKKPIAL